MGVALEEAHRIGRRPLDRPLQAGKLGAQAQRIGYETPTQERFTRSPGRPSKETRGGQDQWLEQIHRARQPSSLPSPPSRLSSALPLSWIFPHIPPPSRLLPLPSHSSSISIFPGTAYARSLPGPSTAAVVAAAETGSWLGCGGERRRMSQPRRPEGNRGERRGRIQGSGGSDKRAAEPPAARIPLGILTGKFTDFSVHLRLVLGMFTQAFLQALTPVGEQWSEHY